MQKPIPNIPRSNPGDQDIPSPAAKFGPKNSSKSIAKPLSDSNEIKWEKWIYKDVLNFTISDYKYTRNSISYAGKNIWCYLSTNIMYDLIPEHLREDKISKKHINSGYLTNDEVFYITEFLKDIKLTCDISFIKVKSVKFIDNTSKEYSFSSNMQIRDLIADIFL